MKPDTTDVAPWIERLARVGFVAKAMLYVTIGLLAASAAVGRGGGATDTRGAMSRVVEAPFGRVLLIIAAIGLIGYSVWRVVQGIKDPEGRGSDAKGLSLRASFIARGLGHALLAFTAFRIAMGNGGGDGNRSEDATARALELPGGTAIVWIIALGVAGFGIYQLYRAATSKLSKQLNRGEMHAETGGWVVTVSRFGIAARGLVFVAIGWLLVQAARSHDASEAGGIADALTSVSSLGRLPFLAIALGLIAYGGYELLNARYRRIKAD